MAKQINPFTSMGNDIDAIRLARAFVVSRDEPQLWACLRFAHKHLHAELGAWLNGRVFQIYTSNPDIGSDCGMTAAQFETLQLLADAFLENLAR